MRVGRMHDWVLPDGPGTPRTINPKTRFDSQLIKPPFDVCEAIRKPLRIESFQIPCVIDPEMSVAKIKLVTGLLFAFGYLVQHFENVLFGERIFLGNPASKCFVNRVRFVMPAEDPPAATADVVEKSLSSSTRFSDAQDD